MTKSEIKAEKAAEKARIAAEKTQKALDSRASKTVKVKEPDPEMVPVGGDAPEPEIVAADPNVLGEKTKSCMESIIQTAESTRNHNPPNIQDAICRIIRLGYSAYAAHVGRPFDTDLG